MKMTNKELAKLFEDVSCDGDRMEAVYNGHKIIIERDDDWMVNPFYDLRCAILPTGYQYFLDEYTDYDSFFEKLKPLVKERGGFESFNSQIMDIKDKLHDIRLELAEQHVFDDLWYVYTKELQEIIGGHHTALAAIVEMQNLLDTYAPNIPYGMLEDMAMVISLDDITQDGLDGVINEYNMACNGDIWGFTVTALKYCPCCGNPKPDNDGMNESSWGYITDDPLNSYMMDSIMEMLV